MQIHRGALWAALAALAGLAPLACQAPAPVGGPDGTSSTAAPKRGGIAVIATREDPPGTWDPMTTSSISLAYVANSVFGDGSLVRPCLDDFYKVCGRLAESWETNTDFTEWTFTVRDGIYWHDGTKFTVDDVLFWADLAYNGAKVGDKTRPSAIFKSNMGNIRDVQAVGPSKVKFTLAAPTPYYLDALASRNVQVAHPKHLMEPKIKAGDVAVGPSDVGYVGLGPYKFAKHDKGSTVQVRRFDRYWEQGKDGSALPYLDGIDFAVIKDLSAVVAAFRTGQLDGGTRGVGFTVSPQQAESLRAQLGDRVWFAEIGGNRETLWFNTLRESPVKDVRVRKAMSLWLDRREGIEGVQNGQGFLTTLMNPKSPWPNPDWETWPGYNQATRAQDKAEARRLLAEAGYPNGFELEYFGQRNWQHQAEWIQGNFAPLGIRIKLDLADTATYNKRRAEGDYLFTSAKGATVTAPELLNAIINSSKVARATYPKHEDQRVADLFEQFGTARDLQTRVAIYRELERRVQLDMVYGIPMFDAVQLIPYRSHLKGLIIPPEDITAYIDFATVWLDK